MGCSGMGQQVQDAAGWSRRVRTGWDDRDGIWEEGLGYSGKGREGRDIVGWDKRVRMWQDGVGGLG